LNSFLKFNVFSVAAPYDELSSFFQIAKSRRKICVADEIKSMPFSHE
jgi:hypothetical protein